VIRTKSIDGKPAVLPGEHVGGGRGVEQPLHAEPPDHAATHPLGERGQVSLGDWPRWQERRRGVRACFGRSWHEDTVGCAHMQMHIMVERRSEAVQKGDAAEPRAGGSRYVGIRGPACRREQEPFDLGQEDLREHRDGLGVGRRESSAAASARRSPTAARAPAG